MRTVGHKYEDVGTRMTSRLRSSTLFVRVSLPWSTGPFCCFLCRSSPWHGPNLWHGWQRRRGY